MIMQRNTLVSTTLVATILGLALWAGQPSARGDGVTGKTQSSTGCSCHGSTANAGVVVTLSGPQTVAPGSTNSYTLTVTGGPAGTTGGFDLRATTGMLVAGTGCKMVTGELVHVDNTHRSWTFQWTAPMMAGTCDMYAVGMTSNGSGSSGDGWNFSGGALNAAFTIQVNDLVDAAPLAPTLELGPALPNPTAGATSLQYTLPAATSVDLDVVNVTGRRVATLVSAAMPAGTYSARWNGKTSGGETAPVGLYFVRLRAAGMERTSRVILSH